ncbi:hypothetical protein Nepgr_008548 [Nepenthes gracilis]|uniref:Uncharacterized protein n=1 Tax=Nepenthes gracilis TaxID=150966 RepID=A0AAD3S8W7_NEPGR|nr:hypothetical protein Nepgr_008548 [Nepenthes gracilis]
MGCGQERQHAVCCTVLPGWAASFRDQSHNYHPHPKGKLIGFVNLNIKVSLMGFEDFEPIFGEAKAEGPIADSAPLNPYLFHVYAPDPSHLKFRASDFRSYTWESVQSLHQLEDMRDYVGIGGSWSEFMDYVISSLKSEDVKLVLEGHSMGIASAKLVAQKSKGLPLISISVSKLPDSVAGEATANLSLELFKAFKDMRNSFIKEQERCCQLTRVISAEQEKSQAIQSQLDAVLYSRRHKLQKTPSDMIEIFSFAKSDTSSMVLVPNSTGEPPATEAQSTKVVNRVVPAYKRSKVRGAVIAEDEG